MKRLWMPALPFVNLSSCLAECADHSWINELNEDPEAEQNAPNKTSREVKSGHFVRVKPTPLPDPVLIAVSGSLCEEIGIEEEKLVEDPLFLRYFSGDLDALKDNPIAVSWATPYALGIYGKDYYHNCPFGNGNGYGDGRAISIGEIQLPNQQHWEFQLKGGGTTPFCRGGDGKAVLRSSVREFLVSEAMHHLGVSTTRAFSLIVSGSETVRRPWYNSSKANIPDHIMALLQSKSPEYRQMIEQKLREPNLMVSSHTAITTRTARSFLRVGHMQLFERRAREDEGRVEELRMIVQHAISREFPTIHAQDISFQEKVLSMLNEASKNFARLTADWIRVGFCQGNFNSDNCLVAGRTMDYGPFGFIEKFEPLWNMWSGGGEHYGFLNQPTAGHKNFESLCRAMEPVLTKEGKEKAIDIAKHHHYVYGEKMQEMWLQKLGFATWSPKVAGLVENIIEILFIAQCDYTIFWRTLANFPLLLEAERPSPSELLEKLSVCLYAPLDDSIKIHFETWLSDWMDNLISEVQGGTSTYLGLSGAMKAISPKFVPREWMLVQAYTEAMGGDYDKIHELYDVFLHPYEEQSKEMEAKYFRKAPPEVYEGTGLGGTAFMT